MVLIILLLSKQTDIRMPNNLARSNDNFLSTDVSIDPVDGVVF